MEGRTTPTDRERLAYSKAKQRNAAEAGFLSAYNPNPPPKPLSTETVLASILLHEDLLLEVNSLEQKQSTHKAATAKPPPAARALRHRAFLLSPPPSSPRHTSLTLNPARSPLPRIHERSINPVPTTNALLRPVDLVDRFVAFACSGTPLFFGSVVSKKGWSLKLVLGSLSLHVGLFFDWVVSLIKVVRLIRHLDTCLYTQSTGCQVS